MRIIAIVGITVAITLVVVFGGLFALVAIDDTSQDVRQTTEFEKTAELQKQATQPKKSISQSPIPTASTPSKDCSGNARCFTGKVTGIVDGDTILVDGQSIRFALASTPELNKPIGLAAKQYVQQICPVGSKVKVDEDDGQTQGSHGRIVGLIYCNGVNLNEAVLEKGFGYLSFVNCDESEFSSNAWAQKSGCGGTQKMTSPQTTTQYYQTKSNCDPNYSGACIPINSPDLDCKDIPSSVKVVGSDTHRLDRDGDGIGCE